MGVSVVLDIQPICEQFDIAGTFVAAEPWGTGHIHDTYRVECSRDAATVRYILQRINHSVFKDPIGVMDNIRRVTAHIRSKLEKQKAPDLDRRTLTLVPARDGRPYCRDENRNFWRMFPFIENTHIYDSVRSPAEAFEVAKSFGEFQNLMLDLPDPALHETISNFHHTPKRMEAFEEVLAEDVCNRAAAAQPEIEFALERKQMTAVLIELLHTGAVPERVTHNDTKFSNVLIDDATGQGICVIDLDTVMPGLALYDFGDMVRTATSPACEDIRDLSNVHMQMPMFEALVRGYLPKTGSFLTKTERRHMAFSVKLITFETGLRFLTDYLVGDTYFKVQREGHNLDRCRAQFKLVESIDTQEDEMNGFVESCKGDNVG
jgi:hypothetical protein